MKIDHDLWLSDIFGHKVFKVSLGPEPVAEILEILASHQCSGQALRRALRPSSGQALYYTKVPAHRVDLVRALSSVGFSVVDVNVTFVAYGGDLPRDWYTAAGFHNPHIVVQDILPAHYGAVLRLAASSFVYSRFHLDPAIPQEMAHQVKRAWVQSYIDKTRGERLLVGLLDGKPDGKPVGFLAVLATTFQGEPCRVIDLIGVDRGYQGQGVGRALVSFFVADSVERYPRLRVGTQVANIPSMRLYQSLGFRIEETAYVLHAHVKAKGKVERSVNNGTQSW